MMHPFVLKEYKQDKIEKNVTAIFQKLKLKNYIFLETYSYTIWD